MTARIFRPSKTAMQSGKAKTNRWILEYEPEVPRSIDPLMGYTVSSDMKSQIRLEFESLEAAKAYAARNGIPCKVQMPQDASRRPMAYADNFRSDRKLPWTH